MFRGNDGSDNGQSTQPRQVGLRCYGTCTAASCAALFLEYFELAFVNSMTA